MNVPTAFVDSYGNIYFDNLLYIALNRNMRKYSQDYMRNYKTFVSEITLQLICGRHLFISIREFTHIKNVVMCCRWNRSPSETSTRLCKLYFFRGVNDSTLSGYGYTLDNLIYDTENQILLVSKRCTKIVVFCLTR